MSSEEIRKVLSIRVNSLNDLVRLAMTYAGPTSQSIFLIKFWDGDKLIIGMLGLFRDYYKFYGLPILYYHICSEEEISRIKDSNYIIISTEGERLEFSKSPKPGMSIPLIHLADKPPIIPKLS